MSKVYRNYEERQLRARFVLSVKEFMKTCSDVKIKRAGVILYTEYQNTLYFGLGCDDSSRDLTDFGGGVKKHETGPGAALREFAEESLVFRSLDLEQVMDCICVHDGVNLIMFISSKVDPKESVCQFDSRHRTHCAKKAPEVCGLVWIPVEEFKNLVECKQRSSLLLYSKVRRLLSNLDWISRL